MFRDARARAGCNDRRRGRDIKFIRPTAACTTGVDEKFAVVDRDFRCQFAHDSGATEYLFNTRTFNLQSNQKGGVLRIGCCAGHNRTHHLDHRLAAEVFGLHKLRYRCLNVHVALLF